MPCSFGCNFRAPTRLPDPKCPRYSEPDPVATLRTDFVVYFRCEDCGEIWAMDKPAREHQVSFGLLR
jgi:hypothetical protein